MAFISVNWWQNNPPLPSSFSSSPSSPLPPSYPIPHSLTLYWPTSSPSSSSSRTTVAAASSKPSRQFRLYTTTNQSNPIAPDLSQSLTTAANNDLPNPNCLSRLVSQFSYQNTYLSLSHAQSILTRLRQQRQLHCLDANSLGLLAVSSTKSGQLSYAVSLINSMLCSDCF